MIQADRQVAGNQKGVREHPQEIALAQTLWWRVMYGYFQKIFQSEATETELRDVMGRTVTLGKGLVLGTWREERGR